MVALAVYLGVLLGLYALAWHPRRNCNPLKPFTCEEE